jgi:hypothetical protein
MPDMLKDFAEWESMAMVTTDQCNSRGTGPHYSKIGRHVRYLPNTL